MTFRDALRSEVRAEDTRTRPELCIFPVTGKICLVMNKLSTVERSFGWGLRGPFSLPLCGLCGGIIPEQRRRSNFRGGITNQCRLCQGPEIVKANRPPERRKTTTNLFKPGLDATVNTTSSCVRGDYTTVVMSHLNGI